MSRGLEYVAAVVGLIGLLLVSTSTVAAQTSPTEVVALGGTVTMHAQAMDRIAEATGATPTRLGGADRYASAVELSRRANPDGADTV